MRLLTHNSLKNPSKGIAMGYPLGLVIEEMEVMEAECNTDFIKNILLNLEWKGVLVAAAAAGIEGMPETVDATSMEDEVFLEACFNLLMNIEVVKGTLTCPETGKTFSIENGIAQFMLPESEV